MPWGQDASQNEFTSAVRRWWAKADAAEIFGEDFKSATGTLGMISRVGLLAGAPIAIAGDVSTLFNPAQNGAAGMADRVMAGTNGVLVAGTPPITGHHRHSQRRAVLRGPLSAYELTCRCGYGANVQRRRATRRTSSGSWAASAKSFHDREAWLSMWPADRDSPWSGSNASVHPHPLLWLMSITWA